jgi:hypothetical protein
VAHLGGVFPCSMPVLWDNSKRRNLLEIFSFNFFAIPVNL